MKRSDSPKVELADEVTRMRQEIDTLRNEMESMKQDLSLCKEALCNMRQELREIPVMEEAKPKKDPFEEVCQFCSDIISPIEIVRQIFAAGTREAALFWTIVDNPPSKNSLCKAYDEQLDTLNILKHNVPFVFEVLSVTELSEGEKTGEVISPDAKLIWER